MAILQATCTMEDKPDKRMKQLEKMSRDLDAKIRSREQRAGRSLEDLEVLVCWLLVVAVAVVCGVIVPSIVQNCCLLCCW